MSTKSTLYLNDGPTASVCIEEEMIEETTHLVLSGTAAHFMAGPHYVNVTLAPAVLDAIAELHARKALPHQREPNPNKHKR